MTTPEDWIEESRSLTNSSSVPLGVPVATHMDMLLRDTRRDLRTACNALEAVLELHDSESSHYSPFAGRTVTTCGACGESRPCPTVIAITAALGVES